MRPSTGVCRGLQSRLRSTGMEPNAGWTPAGPQSQGSAHHCTHSGVEKTAENPPPNPPLVRGGAWRSLTLGDGKCPPRHKCSTENLGFHVLRIWFRKKWGFESPFPHHREIRAKIVGCVECGACRRTSARSATTLAFVVRRTRGSTGLPASRCSRTTVHCPRQMASRSRSAGWSTPDADPTRSPRRLSCTRP